MPGPGAMAGPTPSSPTPAAQDRRDLLERELQRCRCPQAERDGEGQRYRKDEGLPADRKLPAVGNTVDVATATWTNTIGASELIKTWKDPEFDPALRAVYYARVLEIPTPRWTAYDAVRFGVKMPPEIPMFGQERAYTSPIWYTPG